MATYPAGLDYMPDMGAFRVLEPYAPPIVSEFEDGPDLARRSRLGRRAKLAYRIPFTLPSSLETFLAFVEDDLIDGTQRFQMPVYIPQPTEGPAIYATRTVQIEGGRVTIEPFGLGFAVSFTLIVYNWRG